MAGSITALIVQKRNKKRVNVYLDGEFAFGLALIEAAKLRKGQRLTDEDIDHLKALDEIEVAHERALNFLSYRPRSVEEVRRNLQDKQISEAAIEAVVDRLGRAGLLNDEEFARFWIENRERFSPRGERALRYELRQKGISDSIIELVIEDFDQEDAAYRAAKAIFRKRLGDYLARRGFSYDEIRDVVERLWNERLLDEEVD
jgi:regulatory protein